MRILSLTPDGDDARVGWRTAGGHTNLVQSTTELTNTFTDLSAPIAIIGSGDTQTNYLDPGGATNNPTRFYRIRNAP